MSLISYALNADSDRYADTPMTNQSHPKILHAIVLDQDLQDFVDFRNENLLQRFRVGLALAITKCLM